MSARKFRKSRHLSFKRRDARPFKQLTMIGQIVKAFRMLGEQ